MYTDQQATAGLFLAAENPRVVVLSTHGYFLPDRHAMVMNIKPGYGTLVHELVHPYVAKNCPQAGPFAGILLRLALLASSLQSTCNSPVM